MKLSTHWRRSSPSSAGGDARYPTAGSGSSGKRFGDSSKDDADEALFASVEEKLNKIEKDISEEKTVSENDKEDIKAESTAQKEDNQE